MRNLARKVIAVLMTLAILIPAMSFSFAAAPVERIDLNISAITIGVGQKVKTVKPVAYPKGSATTFTWESSDEKIATVNAKGQIKGVKKGSATITISAGGISAELEVNVVKKGKGVTKISLPKTASVVRGKSTSLKATFTPAKPKNKTIIWSSSNESVATVDTKGKVTGVSAGKVTITAISSSGKSAKCTVTVKPVQVKKIKITGKASMLRNKTQQLSVTFKPADADNKNLKWTSSNKKIATVDANGMVTAKKKGTVTITAAAKDGSKVKGTFKITVKKGVFTPTPAPTAEPTAEPTAAPTEAPTSQPTEKPTAVPTVVPTAKPTEKPTAKPTTQPTEKPTPNPEWDNMHIGIVENPPFASYNEYGEFVGIDVEIAQRIAYELGYNAEIHPIRLDILHVLINSGEVEFGMGGVLPDSRYSEHIGYSNPYISDYVVEFYKDNPLIEQVNAILARMKADGTFEELIDKYGAVPEPVPTATPTAAPPAEATPAPSASTAPETTPKPELNPVYPPSGTVLRMVTSADYAPFSYIDENGAITGVDIDIANYIAAMMGCTLQITQADYNSLEVMLLSGRADFAMSAMSVTEEREANLAHSYVYWEDYAIWFPKDFKYIDAFSYQIEELNSSNIIQQFYYQHTGT